MKRQLPHQQKNSLESKRMNPTIEFVQVDTSANNVAELQSQHREVENAIALASENFVDGLELTIKLETDAVEQNNIDGLHFEGSTTPISPKHTPSVSLIQGSTVMNVVDYNSTAKQQVHPASSKPTGFVVVGAVRGGSTIQPKEPSPVTKPASSVSSTKPSGHRLKSKTKSKPIFSPILISHMNSINETPVASSVSPPPLIHKPSSVDHARSSSNSKSSSTRDPTPSENKDDASSSLSCIAHQPTLGMLEQLDIKIDKLTKRLASIEAQIGCIFEAVYCKKSKADTARDEPPMQFELLNSEQDLIDFNNKLEDAEFAQTMESWLNESITREDVDNRLHEAIDLLITRRCFAECSWTGTTNVPGTTRNKIAFSKLTNLLKLFQNIGTNDFVKPDDVTLKKFFMKKITHAPKRVFIKGIRKTCCHKRQKSQ